MPSSLRFANSKVIALASLLIGLPLVIPTSIIADDSLDFSRDVRPILSNKCFTCHGPDEKTREAELRLDIRQGLFQPAESGDIPVVAGNQGESQLVARIISTEDNRMPPSEAEHQLTATEIQTLKSWVEQGAQWDQHWAFVPPNRPDLPPSDDLDWADSPIDRFVQSKWTSRDLKPSPPASRETLLRRVHLDLTGLPPTLEDRAAFLADNSPEAFEKVVDRLLKSKSFGEQMATSWLDAARYADSNGYQNDFGRSMWPWRDWVINSMNRNQPFDQFIIEQIAGDLLPNATRQQKIATGFNRNNRTVTEGGSIDAEWLVENVVDRVETTSTTLLGLTMGCARCHDHKYDPVSQKEFYQFFAFFNNINERGVYQEQRGNSAPLIKAPTSSQQEQLDQLNVRQAKLNQQLTDLENSLAAQRASWESNLATHSLASAPKPIRQFISVTTNNELGFQIEDPSRVVDSALGSAVKFTRTETNRIDLGETFDFHGSQPFSVTAWVKPSAEGAIISRMDHKNSYRGFDIVIMNDGRINVHLIHRWTDDAIKITTHRKIDFNQWNHVAVSWNGGGKAADFSVYLNTSPSTFDANVDTLKSSSDTTTEKPLLLGWRGDTPPLGGLVADVRLFDQQLDQTEVRNVVSFAAVPLAESPSNRWSDDQKALSTQLFRNRFADRYANILEPLSKTKLELIALRRQLPTTMVMEERRDWRQTFVLNRGVYDQPLKDQEVFPGIPAFLPTLKAEHLAGNGTSKFGDSRRPNRLALARWLVDRTNPLTARVTVNRIWQHHFGNGLVSTPEDFGIQSPLPTHPQLLNWLAVDFMENGWNVKRLHKQIVMSKTYRQSSAGTAKSYKADPANQWLSRGPRFRLSSEEIRDNALSVSGLINLQMGGPAIKPYQPEGLWKELAGGASQGPYKQDAGANLYRRSIYINRKRTVPPPSMMTFDSGSRETCQVARQRTNTPLQALALLNDETYVEAARHLATWAIQTSNNDQQRLENAFIRATLRAPAATELAILKRGLTKYRARFAADKGAGTAFVSIGQSAPDASLDVNELAAFTAVASLILNLDETITRE